MLTNLAVSLILTEIFEIFISLILGVRKPKDVLTILAVNMLTNPIVVLLANIVKALNNSYIYYIVILIAEITVIITEGMIYRKLLDYNKISGMKLSIINNLLSYLSGIVINILFI